MTMFLKVECVGASGLGPEYIVLVYSCTLLGPRCHYYILIKHPTRDTCFYLWERGERVGPPDPPAPALSSHLAHVCSNPGKITEYGVMTFQPIREVT